MNELYPLKFSPVYFHKIWGGQKIRTILNKDFGKLPNCGECWEISGVEENISVVANGFLAGNSLDELIEVYMGELVGEKNYERFGTEFPLLIKFIDANDDLSIQVHPNDELAKKRHNAYGKTEMWYIIEAEKGAKINTGFNRKLDKEEYLRYFEEGRLMDILSFTEVRKGDVFFTPAGRVHAIGSGILLAEIQQTSDVTYRIFDFNRKDADGNERELHTELVPDALDFSFHDDYKTHYAPAINQPVQLADCPYFTTNLIEFDDLMDKDSYELDSFIIYICIEGSAAVQYGEGTEVIKMGETILIPASLATFTLKPINDKAKLLEVYIKS